MAICPTIGNKDFEELKSIFGERVAYFLWDKNGGHPFHLTKEGNQSKLFADLLANNQIKGDRVKAIKAKSQFYSKSFKKSDNLVKDDSQLKLDFSEPSIDEIEINKEHLSDKHTNIYSYGTTIEAYEALPYKEYHNGFKVAKFSDKRSAQALVNETGGTFNTVLNGAETLYKVTIVKPLTSSDLTSDNLVTDVSSYPKDIQDILKNKKSLIKILNKKITEKSPRVVELRNKIAGLKNQVRKIEEDHETVDMKQIIKNDINLIGSNLNNIREALTDPDLSNDELYDLQDLLLENSYYIKGWINLIDRIDEIEESIIKESMNELSGIIARFNEAYNRLDADVISRVGNVKSYKDNFSSEEMTEATDDISKAKSLFFGLGETHIPLLTIVDDIIKDVAYKINNAFNSKKTEIEKWITKLEKSTGKTREQISKMFLQFENGEWTGNFIGRYSQSFFNKRKELLEAAKESNNWDAYYKWLSQNTHSISRENLDYLRKTKTSELEAMPDDWTIGVFSKAEALEQKRLLKKYFEAKQAQIDFMMMSDVYSDGVYNEKTGEYTNDKIVSSDGLTAADEFGLELQGWENLYSPLKYAGSQNKRGSEGYIYTINSRPIDKWIDLNYQKLEEDPQLYEFYKYMRDTFHENNKSLPYFNNLQVNYLPELKKTLRERTGNSREIWNKFKLLSTSLKLSVSSEMVSKEDYRPNIGGKDIKKINVSMMDNKMSIENKESDIFKVLVEHSKMALNHKYKSQIEPMALAAQDMLDRTEETESVNGRKRTLFGSDKKRSGKMVNAKELLEYAIDSFLYDEHKADGGKDIFTIKVVDDNGKIQKRRINAGTLVDTFNTVTYHKQLGAPNFITPTVNLTFGTVSNMIYASANKDVTEKEMVKATVQMFASVSKTFGAKANMKKAMKIYAFMETLDLFGDIHDGNIGTDGNKRTFSEWVTILQTKAEFINQGALMLGILRTQKLKDKNGKEISIFDAFNAKDGELIWNESRMGKQVEVLEQNIFDPNKKGVNIKNLAEYIGEINKTVHGDYKTPMLVKKTALGRASMLYKRWIPRSIEHRFGIEKPNHNLLNDDGYSRGRTVKGRYRFAWEGSQTKDGVDLLARQTFALLAKSMVLGKKSFSELSEVDRVNMIRNMRELQIIGMLMGVVALLGQISGDDDEGINAGLNMTINMLSKTQADMTFFMNPNSTETMLNNIIPMMSTVGDMVKVIHSIGGLITGDDTYNSGPWRGHSKFGISLMRATPYTSGGIKMYNYGSRVFQLH